MDCLCVAGNQYTLFARLYECVTFVLHLCMFLFLGVMKKQREGGICFNLGHVIRMEGNLEGDSNIPIFQATVKRSLPQECIIHLLHFSLQLPVESGWFVNLTFCQFPQLSQHNTWCILFSNSGQNTDGQNSELFAWFLYHFCRVRKRNKHA